MSIVKKNILVFLFLTINKILFSQPVQEWISFYDAIGFGDEARFLKVDDNGNVYETGYSTGNGTQYDFCTVKYNSSGVRQWASRYSGSANNNDGPSGIALDNDGNVFVTGSCANTSSGWDVVTIKYSNDGIQQWASTVTSFGEQNEGGYAIEVDNSDNVCITGSIRDNPSIGPPDLDYVTIKYDAFGNILWQNRFNGLADNDDEAFAMCIDSKNNIIVTGYSYSSSVRKNDIVTIKYDPNGNVLWTIYFNDASSLNDYGMKIKTDLNDNIIVGGISEDYQTAFDFQILKYNSGGVLLWQRKFNGAGNSTDRISDLEIDRHGNIITGGTATIDSIDESFTLIKYDPSGAIIWTDFYNSNTEYSDKLSAIALDDSGNVYASGYSFKEDLDVDFVTLRFNKDGTQDWVRLFHGDNIVGDFAYDIQVDRNFNVYTAGLRNSLTTLSDYVTIKYSQSTSVSHIENSIPDRFSLFQNYPNPFNPVTKIKFDITRDERRETRDVKLVVYDALGREVTTLVNEKLSAGSYETEYNGNEFASGIYFYKLSVGEFSDVKRMVLIK